MSSSSLLERVGLAVYVSAVGYALGYALFLVSMLMLAGGFLGIIGEVSRVLPFRVELPAQVYIGLALTLIGLIAAILFAVEVFVEAKRGKRFGLTVRSVAVPLTLFAIAQALMNLGVAVAGLSVTNPILSAVGAAALLIGFKLYFSRLAGSAPEYQLAGAVAMVAAVALLYVIAPSQLVQAYSILGAGMESLSGFGLSLPLPPLQGPLASELRLEAAALFILAVLALVAAFLTKDQSLSLANWVIPIAVVVFSIGLAYSGFSTASAMSNLSSITQQFSRLASYMGGAAWYVYLANAAMVLALVAGLVLGIAGLTASIAVTVWIAQLAHTALQGAAQAPPPPPPPPPQA
jgi:hypothetical protein